MRSNGLGGVPRPLTLALALTIASCSLLQGEADTAAPPVAVVSSREKPAPPPAWPSSGAALSAPALEVPAGFGKRRVYVDAGHGAKGNEGTVSVACKLEQDFTLEVASHLARWLRATGAFEVMLSREGKAGPEYKARLAEAAAWGAEALVSVHMDARGQGKPVRRTAAGRDCLSSHSDVGFALLWSDEAEEAAAQKRHELARSLAARMTEAGFEPYGGEDYPGLYETDIEEAGVFLDRHPPGYRVMLLRKPKMPVVIVETHHSWHAEEDARWHEKPTRDAFAAAVASGLVDFFSGRKEKAAHR